MKKILFCLIVAVIAFFFGIGFLNSAQIVRAADPVISADVPIGTPSAVTEVITETVSAPTLTGITITTPATKLIYTIGESLDITGLTVTGTYSDTTTKIETVTTANITGFNSSTPATGQTLTITIGDQTTSFIIDINDVLPSSPPPSAIDASVPEVSVASENKTLYFSNEPAQLTDSHVLSAIPPVDGNSQVTSITSTDVPSFRHFHPGETNVQHIFNTAEPAHTSPVDSASWISETPFNGTFEAGSWNFVIHKNDNTGGEFSKPHINMFSSPSNISLADAVFLFDAEGPDWWNNQDEQISFTKPAVGEFVFNNDYLVAQLFDHCIADCNKGKTLTIFEDGLTLSAQTRIETPLFTSSGEIVPPPPPPAPVDTIAPIITMNGTSPIEIIQGSVYIDVGATASDNADPIVTVSAISTVNISVIGTYTVTYNAVDLAGNSATPVVRIVNVIAAPPAPVPTLTGIAITAPAAKLIYTVGDSLDITGLAVTGNYSDGSQKIETVTTANITGFDSSAPATGQVLTIAVGDQTTNFTIDINAVVLPPSPPPAPVDTTAPVITILGENPANVILGEVYIDAGATATDDTDGDLTANIAITGLPIDTSAVGIFTITYTVADAAGNGSILTRIVNVVAVPIPAPAPVPSPVPVANTPPVVEPIPQQTIIIGTPVTFQVLAADAQGDPLTFSLGPDAPAGATIDPVSGVFFWMPAEIGTFTLDILVSDGVNTPVPAATGRLIENRILGPDGKFGTADDTIIGGMATWEVVKAQTRELLGIELDDLDVLDLPLLAVDAYGNFIEGPHGFPQLVVSGTSPDDPRILIEGDPFSPIDASLAIRSGHPFLVDIAHDANPKNTRGTALLADSDNTVGLSEPGTYDNELLDSHYIAGDGRVNENIGLIAVHHMFHSEHNRLIEHIKSIILQTGDLVFLNEWLMSDSLPTVFPSTREEISALSWNGERLFQAAKFGTEMQYQHLVFEEFARKVQPQVNVFSGYHTDIDPAIVAEFAHTVYRFGHTMLTDTMARTNPDGSTNDIGLIQAFLNPLEFAASGTTPEQAAGAIVNGMTRQVGSEIDEFVTEALRNNLLGLPLDLATINLARGRDTGIPTLNEARRQFYEATGGESDLKPYESWTDFGLGIRHPESLINFIAAYGTHLTITSAVTLADKRAAATLLVLGGVDAPSDRLEFLNESGFMSGLDDVDFWIGGLAEKQMPFGGLLGSTFNFVFEMQMEKLQDGDRLYYLSRNAGLNFLTQLEQNSFAELVMRNTEGVKHLPHDIFSHPSFTIEAGTIDPLDTATLTPDTIVMPDGTIRYVGIEHIVIGGTAGDDRLQASEGDDTIWGDAGNDRLEGGAGNDALIGGAGDDIITDIFGDDTIKGGSGSDVINGGSGFDLILGGSGQDFILGSRDPKEIFGGLGNDFIIGSDAADEIFGNEGDDWIEGGSGADLIQGDNGDPFQNSPTIGNDVIIGGGGDDDYDSESGDDIMAAGPGIERNEGMLGFDWVIYKLDPQPANADMLVTGLLPPSVNDLRDRFDLVEGLSGGPFDDILRGDNRTSTDLLDIDTASGQNNALNNAGQISLINGLQSLLGNGVISFSGGNIILGGDGSDILEGRGGDDILDGDAWLNVRLSVRDASNPDIEIQSADSMNQLQSAMFAGTINPSQIRIVREILTSPIVTDYVDVAVFSGNLSDYTISLPDLRGQITVSDNRDVNGRGGGVSDGIDILRNIERLQFADQIIDLIDGLNMVAAPMLENNFPVSIPDDPSSDLDFAVSKSDLQFILDQIKIAEAHVSGASLSSLIPKDVLPWGLRTVDGSFNNIVSGQSDFGISDKTFPRLTVPIFNQAESVTIDLDGPGPLAVGASTSYAQTKGFVFDSEPRLISNLIVDQTINNPAAVAAAGEEVLPDSTGTLFIPNIAPDMGLSASFNSWFILFGQFFDHGLDLVNKGGSGTVFIPLKSDDPLFNPLSRSNFMVLTRATNQPGPDGILGTLDDIHEHINQTSPFVDQNQTYTSHPSHQVFLRAYKPDFINNSINIISSVSVAVMQAPDLTPSLPIIDLPEENLVDVIPPAPSASNAVVVAEEIMSPAITVPSNGGTSIVIIPDGTVISRVDGGSFNVDDLSISAPLSSSLTGLETGVVVDGVLQWGIPSVGLQFSSPITLSIFVGNSLNGQTLDVRRSVTGTSDWTTDGIVAPTCTVADGLCTFQATKASFYAATRFVSEQTPTAIAASSTASDAAVSSGEESGNSSGETVAAVLDAVFASNSVQDITEDSLVINKTDQNETEVLGTAEKKETQIQEGINKINKGLAVNSSMLILITLLILSFMALNSNSFYGKPRKY